MPLADVDVQRTTCRSLKVISGFVCLNSDQDLVLVDVLAKRGRYPSLVEDVFRKSFPNVYRVIKSINRDDHGSLIRLLQRLESWLVIENVSPRLLGRIPFVTLHDAIFSRQYDVSKVSDAFNDTFDDIGFSMALKSEF